jgi:hypothetical protein
MTVIILPSNGSIISGGFHLYATCFYFSVCQDSLVLETRIVFLIVSVLLLRRSQRVAGFIFGKRVASSSSLALAPLSLSYQACFHGWKLSTGDAFCLANMDKRPVSIPESYKNDCFALFWRIGAAP